MKITLLPGSLSSTFSSLLLGVTVAACGSFSSGPTSVGSAGTSGVLSNGGSTSAGGIGSDSTGGVGNTPGGGVGNGSGGGPSCANLQCNGLCVDSTTDNANCGACGNVCGSGQSCISGACSCGTGQTICSGSCKNLQTDAANCGSCGKTCASDQTCQSGSCACTTGRVECTGSSTCIDTSTDPANCGSCGKACATGQVCSSGTCATTCPTGQTACSGACVNLQTDSSHCGTCTTTCSAASGQSCSSGSCTCSTGMTSCSGSCKNLQTDPANCGACATACGSGQTCTAGACACATGQSLCSGSCKNLQTDAANCGTCGKACSTGQSCTAGACACATGQTLCTNSCVNTQTDTANCGACGKPCTTGQTCTAGACTGGTTTQTVCDIFGAAGNTCVAAHSTTRLLVSTYTGALYQVCKGTFAAGPSSCKGTTQDIKAVNGLADSATQDSFCAGGSCTISKIYDQSGNGNDLEPSPRGGAKNTPDNPASATGLKTTLNGHTVYGILIQSGIGYRGACSACNTKTPKGIPTGDQPETEYMVTSQQQLVDGCCFDYGNAETSSNDDGNGTMDAVYFGGGVVWGTGSPGGHNNGPWVMGDLENGLYAGWENNQDQNISTNTPLKFDYVTAILVGDSCTGATGCAGTGTARPNGRFALYGGDATSGTLKTEYDGPRPYPPGRTGYVPMKKQGSIILGTGGDNSDSAGGRWYEGVVTTGAATLTTLNAVQANIVAAKYGK